MSVDVTMLPAATPHRLRDEDITRRREYKDTAEQAYWYSVHASGSLIVWRGPADKSPGLTDIEAVLSPSAWEEVQGDLYESL